MSEHTTVSSHVRSALQAAVQAPSSHNTQPWRFSVHDGKISLYADRTRSLPCNDPDDRELIISCGCALLNLRTAAEQAGSEPLVSLLPEAEDADHLATVQLRQSPNAGGESDTADLASVIEKRRTHRKDFLENDIPAEIFAKLKTAAQKEEADLLLLDSTTKRQEIADLIGAGDRAQWAHAKWRAELARWMRPHHTGDGLTVPRLLAPVIRIVVRNFNVGKWVAEKDGRLAEAAPALLLLHTTDDSPEAWLRAGQALQRTLLTACVHGLQCSYLNQPIQVTTIRSKLRHATNCAGYPQILLRVGYPRDTSKPAVRRTLEEVLIKTD